MSEFTDRSNAVLCAISRDETGEFRGSVRMVLWDWPQPDTAVRLIEAATRLHAGRIITWWVRPPAKKYLIHNHNHNQLALEGL